ncbi:MAG: hypothetical protein JSV03_08605, partial [Planctomycetota bacterium]
VSTTFVDDTLSVQLNAIPLIGTDHDNYLSTAVLNQHVGSANQGTVSVDFSNYEDWTWSSIDSREVVLIALKQGEGEDGTIFVDTTVLEVQHAQLEPTIILWEEL